MLEEKSLKEELNIEDEFNKSFSYINTVGLRIIDYDLISKVQHVLEDFVVGYKITPCLISQNKWGFNLSVFYPTDDFIKSLIKIIPESDYSIIKFSVVRQINLKTLEKSIDFLTKLSKSVEASKIKSIPLVEKKNEKVTAIYFSDLGGKTKINLKIENYLDSFSDNFSVLIDFLLFESENIVKNRISSLQDILNLNLDIWTSERLSF